MGIYHADLALRNTIRVSRGGWSAFKIIDFDLTFKVVKTGEKDRAYGYTEELIDFWLYFKFDSNKPYAPFGEISFDDFASSY